MLTDNTRFEVSTSVDEDTTEAWMRWKDGNTYKEGKMCIENGIATGIFRTKRFDEPKLVTIENYVEKIRDFKPEKREKYYKFFGITINAKLSMVLMAIWAILNLWVIVLIWRNSL